MTKTRADWTGMWGPLFLTQKPQGRAGLGSDIMRHTTSMQQVIPII